MFEGQNGVHRIFFEIIKKIYGIVDEFLIVYHSRWIKYEGGAV